MAQYYEDQESSTEPGVAAAAEDLDEYKQIRLPNGRFLVIDPSPGAPGLPGSASDQAQELAGASDAAAKAKDAEAALATHSFGSYELSFQEVFNHDELDVSSDSVYSANGMDVQEDDASYRETSSSDWTEKFSATVPEGYNGDVKISWELKVTGTDQFGHVRILQDGEVVHSEHTDSESYIEGEYIAPNVGGPSTTEFKLEIRAVDASAGGSGGAKTRIRRISVTPEFTHDGQTFWAVDVARVALPDQEFRNKLRL